MDGMRYGKRRKEVNREDDKKGRSEEGKKGRREEVKSEEGKKQRTTKFIL